MIENGVDYAKLGWKWHHHRIRYERFVKSRKHQLPCLACRGAGGEYNIIDPEIGGPWEECGWCEGTGLMSPHRRGAYLTECKRAKRGLK
jgi:hypothetical protein